MTLLACVSFVFSKKCVKRNNTNLTRINHMINTITQGTFRKWNRRSTLVGGILYSSFLKTLFSCEIIFIFPQSYLKPDLNFHRRNWISVAFWERKMSDFPSGGLVGGGGKEQRGELSFPSPWDFVNVEPPAQRRSATQTSKRDSRPK